ncbi:hypothetical protein [Actinomadura rupiterrae]|uniref:hypothetical protein n=1 Tax=Actinomadura rupiterrae TaxID=559627 RepID=UPI0020A477DB|nr:hypothetical protein [Actinomadura rupiterrae]MCP2342944.1 hypothetical protein [Actinomadura rupiterrae]
MIDPADSARSPFQTVDPARFEELVDELFRLVPDLAIASLGHARGGALVSGPCGLVDVLPFRAGLTEESYGWTAHADWAALILFPSISALNAEVRPSSVRRIIMDCMRARVYLFPAQIFTDQASTTDGTFQRIDHLDNARPGMLWINNLPEAAARGDLASYQVAFPNAAT